MLILNVFARYPKYLNCVMKLPESLKAFRKVLSIEIRTYDLKVSPTLTSIFLPYLICTHVISKVDHFLFEHERATKPKKFNDSVIVVLVVALLLRPL